jgi:hypothetical protein
LNRGSIVDEANYTPAQSVARCEIEAKESTEPHYEDCITVICQPSSICHQIDTRLRIRGGITTVNIGRVGGIICEIEEEGEMQGPDETVRGGVHSHQVAGG